MDGPKVKAKVGQKMMLDLRPFVHCQSPSSIVHNKYKLHATVRHIGFRGSESLPSGHYVATSHSNGRHSRFDDQKVIFLSCVRNRALQTQIFYPRSTLPITSYINIILQVSVCTMKKMVSEDAYLLVSGF